MFNNIFVCSQKIGTGDLFILTAVKTFPVNFGVSKTYIKIFQCTQCDHSIVNLDTPKLTWNVSV